MSWRTENLGELIENFSVRAKDHKGVTSELEFYGVSNEDGITKSKYAAEDKAEDYKIIENGCFAYNPYRINVGSIALLEDDVEGLISPAYVVFKTKPKSIIPQLLLKFLKSKEGLRQIKLHARGTVRQALRFEDLCKIEIALPNYDEQILFFKKILDVESVSVIVSSELTNQLDLLKQLRQALLHEAMQGKLTAKWREKNPDVEPASELLKKLKAEKEKLVKEGKIKKQKPLSPIKEDELPFEIPESWEWCRLGEIVNLVTSGSRDWAKYYSKTGAIFLRMGNLSKESYNLRLDKIQHVIPPNNSEGKRTRLEENDLLISITGEVGNLGLIPKNFGEAYINQHTGLVRLNKQIVVQYIANCFLSSFLKQQFNEPQRGLKNSFRLTDINYLIIPLPSKIEQQQIVAKLDKLMQYCYKLEESIKTSQQQNEMLLQQVLREALEPEK